MPNQKLISEYLNIYPDKPDKGMNRPYSWAIEFCELAEPKMRMALLFERTGVQPYCAWHWGQGVYADEYCAGARDATKREITVCSTHSLTHLLTHPPTALLLFDLLPYAYPVLVL